jgi:hypothetical protein
MGTRRLSAVGQGESTRTEPPASPSLAASVCISASPIALMERYKLTHLKANFETRRSLQASFVICISHADTHTLVMGSRVETTVGAFKL